MVLYLPFNLHDINFSSCLVGLAKALDTKLSGSSENGHPSLFLDLSRGSIHSFTSIILTVDYACLLFVWMAGVRPTVKAELSLTPSKIGKPSNGITTSSPLCSWLMNKSP